MQRTARIIVTDKCLRNCEYCCNKLDSAPKGKKTNELSDLNGYDNYAITGGEPMMAYDNVIGLMWYLKRENPGSWYYLYTSGGADNIVPMAKLFDGITFTVHETSNEVDLKSLYHLQDWLCEYDGEYSSRLMIHPNFSYSRSIKIRPPAWSTVALLEIQNPAPLPTGEDLWDLTETL